jgi:ribosome-binding protein aMBF1 (putative translation factor)
MDIKDRRKAQGWSRAQLAERAALDPRVIQLIELGQWTEPESLGRCDAVLGMAERGEADPHLKPPAPREDQQIH